MKINLTEAFQSLQKYFPNEKTLKVECAYQCSQWSPEPTFQWSVVAGEFTAYEPDFSVALAEVVAKSRVKAATSNVVVDTEAPQQEKAAAEQTDVPL